MFAIIRLRNVFQFYYEGGFIFKMKQAIVDAVKNSEGQMVHFNQLTTLMKIQDFILMKTILFIMLSQMKKMNIKMKKTSKLIMRLQRTRNTFRWNSQ